MRHPCGPTILVMDPRVALRLPEDDREMGGHAGLDVASNPPPVKSLWNQGTAGVLFSLRKCFSLNASIAAVAVSTASFGVAVFFHAADVRCL